MMKFILTLCVFVATALASVSELSSSNFYDVVGKDVGVLVEFYTPWCTHCKQLEPIYSQVADSFAHSPNIHIAKIDADEYKKFVKRFDVRGYPTIKYFAPNNGDVIDYTGFRDFDGLTKFITHHSNIKPFPSTSSHVVELTNENFDQTVLSDSAKTTLVMFYAPWCGHCKALMPTYEALSRTYAREDSCQVAKINVDDKSNAEIGTRYKIGSFPTLKLFKQGSETPLHYDKARTHAAFVDYLNTHCSTNRQTNGELNEKAGLAEELEGVVKEFMHASNQQKLGIAEQLSDSTHKVYLRVMSKIITNGVEYIDAEIDRLTRLLGSHIQNTKRDQLTIKLNILHIFKSSLRAHDEL